jgi:hypothetical protein
LTVGDVRNTRQHINTVFNDGPGIYKFPSDIPLQVKIHGHKAECPAATKLFNTKREVREYDVQLYQQLQRDRQAQDTQK